MYLAFVPVSGTELLNAWNFLSGGTRKVVFCDFNWVTFGAHLKVETGCQEKQPCDQKFVTFSPTPPPGLQGWERGEGLEAKDNN